MRHKFNNGNFVEDLEVTLNDALTRGPALIVVPTEREVRTFERRFAEAIEGKNVWCCSFTDYYHGAWMSISPRPMHIYIFRIDDIIRNLSADAYVEYMTSIGKKNYKKEEETNEEN